MEKAQDRSLPVRLVVKKGLNIFKIVRRDAATLIADLDADIVARGQRRARMGPGLEPDIIRGDG